jgi:membrane dipeptidase
MSQQMPRRTSGESHERSIIVDAACPGDFFKDNFEWWIAGGVGCCVVTVASTESAREAIAIIGAWHNELERASDRLALVSTVQDVADAREAGKLAVVLQLQGTHPIEYDLDLVTVYQRLGIGIVQLAYNQRSPVGDGCEEPSDAGLSRFGRSVVSELNRLGMVVDLSHVGRRTSLEAIDASTAPCIFSHSNADSLYPHPRNITDEQIHAVAEGGGVVGVVGFGPFVGPQPTVDRLIDHIDHIMELVGPDHVGLGLDYDDPDRPIESYNAFIRSGVWSADNYPPPPWAWVPERPSDVPKLTVRLQERGYSSETIGKVLGDNFLRVFGQVWGR